MTLILFSCSKTEINSVNAAEDIHAKLLGKWYLISETKSGSYDNATYKGLPNDYIEYRSDGKAHSRLQGQYDLTYDYSLNNINKTILFQYVDPHPYFMISQPCNTGPGCLRLAEIKFLSNSLLVLGNTFRDTTNGVISTLIITDSLYR